MKKFLMAMLAGMMLVGCGQNKTEEPKAESGPEAKPEWIVEKPVPVGSEAAKRIIAKVAADNPPPKKKGRPRKNDD